MKRVELDKRALPLCLLLALAVTLWGCEIDVPERAKVVDEKLGKDVVADTKVSDDAGAADVVAANDVAAKPDVTTVQDAGGPPNCDKHDDCDDGNKCELARCHDKKCRFIARICNDGKPCTQDFCGSDIGCIHPVKSGAAVKIHVSTIASAATQPEMVGANPQGIAVAKDGTIYFAAAAHHKIMKLASDGTPSVFAGTTRGLSNSPMAPIQFDTPTALALQPGGALVVADTNNHRIVTLMTDGKMLTTLAGTGKPGSDDGPAEKATLTAPIALALGPIDKVYFLEQGKPNLRMIASNGEIQTLKLATPLATNKGLVHGLVLAENGAIYIADQHKHCIRMYPLAGVVAGYQAGPCDEKSPGFKGGQFKDALFNKPSAMVFGLDDALYVAHHHGIAKITDGQEKGGIVTMLVGASDPEGDDGGAEKARFSSPGYMALGPGGDLFLTEPGKDRIRRIQLASLACDDGDTCTVGDKCVSDGKCAPVGAKSCDDANPCTKDSCESASGCVFAAVDDDTACEDGNKCTDSGKCAAGKCVFSPSNAQDGKDCGGGKVCNKGACLAKGGCKK